MLRFIVLAAGIVAPLLWWSLAPVPSSGAATSLRAEDIDRKLRAAQGRLSQQRARQSVLTTDLSRHTARIRVLERKISRLASREARVQVDVDRQEAVLKRTQRELRAQRARRVRLRARLAVARAGLARRLVEQYEADRPDMVTVVLNSGGFADLLERVDFLRRIAASDRAIVRTVRSAHLQSTALATRLTVLERRQSAATAIIVRRRDEIATVRRTMQGSRLALVRARVASERTLARVRIRRRAAARDVSGLLAQQANVRRALAAGSRAVAAATVPAGPVRGAGGGPMIWPVNGVITSPFCESRSWEACHPGLDIGVGQGTPIRAAAAGTVVLMQPEAQSGGYGNFTCVQHSASVTTCYAHQSRFGTAVGRRVSQGQVIGYVGSTGRSSGPHLHWEVRVGGQVRSPLGYL